ncbi:MAG TPA: hypothetical protein VGB30_12260 [bacterium]|jgi:hypothetical protein
MFRKVLALAAATVLLFGMACSGNPTPVTPDKTNQGDIDTFFNQFDLSSPVVGEVTYKDLDGNVLSYWKIGRDGNDLYIMESRGADIDIDVTSLEMIDCWITYNNPRGTIGTGPNAGYPYYYIGDTVNYDICLFSKIQDPIGVEIPPWTGGPATVTAEMHYAAFGPFNNVVVGPLMPGAPVFIWHGAIYFGWNPCLNDDYYIPAGTTPGLDLTTVRIEAPAGLGVFDYIFHDGICGIWDPQ